MVESILIVDALAAGHGRRKSSRDSIGCGPRTIAGIFEANDLECRIIRSEDITSRRQLKRFSHLTISAMTMDIDSCRHVIQSWRRANKSGLVIVGGPIALDPKPVLKALHPDVLVIGEGEGTLTELISKNFFDERIDLSHITGIGYFESGQPVINRRRSLIPEDDLSKFRPSVDRIVDYQAYQASKVYVEVLRGCSNFQRTALQLPDGRQCNDCGNCFSADLETRLDCPIDIPPGCGFCSVPSTWGPPRSRSKTDIVEEIRGLLELGVHRIVLEAPDFLDYMRGSHPLTDACEPKPNLDAISSLLNDIVSLPQFDNNNTHLAIENIKACLFTDDVAQVIAKSVPTTSPNIGLETGSEHHARQIGKCGTPYDVIRAVRTARSYGMNPFVYLIYGLPGETPESVEQSISMMRELSKIGVERVILYGFRPLPNSAFASFPEPTLRNPLAERMRRVAQEINREKKTDYVGKTVRGVVAEPSWAKKGYSIVYPLGEGPIMTVHGGFSPGTLLDIKITKVLSEGLLLGVVVDD